MPAGLAGFALIGAGLPTLTVAVATLLQRSTPHTMMGRVAAGYDAIGTVPTTASIAGGAVLVGIWPYQAILAVSAVGCAAAALLMIILSRSARPPAHPQDTTAQQRQASTVGRWWPPVSGSPTPTSCGT